MTSTRKKNYTQILQQFELLKIIICYVKNSIQTCEAFVLDPL